MSNWGIAACACGEPLVSTMSFSRFEFVCVRDGRKYTFFGPEKPGLPETPENEARLEANRARWEEMSKGLLSGGVMLERCDACRSEHRPHLFHASPDEVRAHEAALVRLEEAWKGVPA